MKLHKLHRSIVWPFMIVVGVFSLCLTGCKEDIDESNLYTFTGETIEEAVRNGEDARREWFIAALECGMEIPKH